MAIETAFPNQATAFVDEESRLNSAWFYLLLNLWRRTGDASGIIDVQDGLNKITTTPGSLVTRDASSWVGFGPPGALARVLRSNGSASFAWAALTGAEFGTKGQNLFLGGPVSGADANPTFRALDPLDIPGVSVLNSATATGTGQSDAFVLTTQWTTFSTVPLNSGCVCNNAAIGKELWIFNNGANPLSIYPKVGSQINSLGVNNAYALPTNRAATLYPMSATQLFATVAQP